MFETLNLPETDIKVRNQEHEVQVFDIVRQQWLNYTPEEWVRQSIVHFLIKYQKVPSSLIAIEMPIKVNKLNRRCDIVVYSNNGKPKLIVECKASTVKISQTALEQVSQYNIALKVPFLMVTNGLQHFAFKIDFANGTTTQLNEIPDYDFLLKH
ncbi:MAG: restriction endonuclease subunit R [Salinivirgaceae bacterium]|nr:MAG: restriction endonuclease subunit R [Salinivirgaceae bacterium]